MDLELEKKISTAAWTLVSSDNSADNRKRITSLTADLDPTAPYRMRLVGNDVTSDDEGCGMNSMRVFYAWFREDSDRETTENLPNVRPE